ncbi:hypothetical protein [Bacteroides caecigallinarum]|nr:hypothetical protein [Bacteroides caecigallinarum]
MQAERSASLPISVQAYPQMCKSLHLSALLPVCLPAGTQAYRRKRKQAH